MLISISILNNEQSDFSRLVSVWDVLYCLFVRHIQCWLHFHSYFSYQIKKMKWMKFESLWHELACMLCHNARDQNTLNASNNRFVNQIFHWHSFFKFVSQQLFFRVRENNKCRAFRDKFHETVVMISDWSRWIAVKRFIDMKRWLKIDEIRVL